MAWRLFGKSVTSEVAVNSLKCGAGRLGVEQTYDTYFLGIRTSSGNTRLNCFGGIANNGNDANISFNSQQDKLEFLPQKKYRIEKDDKTNWYRWTCKSNGNSGIAPTRAGAKNEGKKYCGTANFEVSEVLTTKLTVEYQDISF
jgi:hypothetical protein